MRPNQDPFTTRLDLPTGMLEPERAVSVTDLDGMPGYYLEQDGAENRVVYRVSAVPVPQTGDEIAHSTTVIEPGTVGREYHMTKGHFHAVWRRSEIYVGLSGEGVLLMATADGDHRAEPLRPGNVCYIPGGWAHRSVNTGAEPLVFLATYIGDAGYDYRTIAEQGFPVLVVAGSDGPEIVPNPRYRAVQGQP